MKKKPASQNKLKKDVLEKSLCTGCGACVNLCPYQVIYSDRTVQLHECDLADGRCYKFCPRTPINSRSPREMLFDIDDLTLEIGAVKNYYWSRAADPSLRARAQHGGTVTALLELALEEELIDCAVVCTQGEEFYPEGVPVRKRGDLRKYLGSKFMVSPTVALVNALGGKSDEKIGVVATPCQALALAKMRLVPQEGEETAQLPKLVIGLFCGWILSAEKFAALLQLHGLLPEQLTGMDIPAGKDVLEICSNNKKKSIALSDVEDCIRPACRFCFDSTAEYADVAVGAARCGGDPEKAHGWNQLIVRTARGEEIIRRAVARGALEIQEAPANCLRELKNAAGVKKRAALKNIIDQTGSSNNLLYLDAGDPAVKKYLPASSKSKRKK